MTPRTTPEGPSLTEAQTLAAFPDFTVEEARATPSESGYGWTLDALTPYFPGIPCCECGKFVGRDGHIHVEHFEMSSEIASVDGTCRRCLDA